MLTPLVPVGYGNFVSLDEVVAMVPYSSDPIVNLVRELRAKGKVIDFTAGREIRTVFFLIPGNVILSAFSPGAITKRAGLNIIAQ